MGEGKVSLTIESAYRNLQSTENKIILLETQRAIKKGIKASNLKDIIVSGGKLNNNAMLDAILKSDEYSEKLRSLYLSKISYEEFILTEINIYRNSKQGLIISFLKNIETYNHETKRWEKSLTWKEIAKKMDYSIAQCKRFYSEYKGRTPSNNNYVKDEPQ